MDNLKEKYAVTLALGICIIFSPASHAEDDLFDGLDNETSVSQEQLANESARGAQEIIQINRNSLNARLDNNQAIHTFSGDNIISNDAFSGASGLTTAIQNSGNNVIIQDATILNVFVDQ